MITMNDPPKWFSVLFVVGFYLLPCSGFFGLGWYLHAQRNLDPHLERLKAIESGIATLKDMEAFHFVVADTTEAALRSTIAYASTYDSTSAIHIHFRPGTYVLSQSLSETFASPRSKDTTINGTGALFRFNDRSVDVGHP